MAFGTDMSELLTSVAADYSCSLLYEIDWLIVQMVNQNPVGCCLSNWAFEGNVSLTVCSDYLAVVTNRLILTPGKSSVRADVMSERILQKKLLLLRRCAVHFCH